MKLWSLKYSVSALILMWFVGAFTPVHAAAFQVSVTVQRFEKGLMIFRTDTGDIWVFADDGRALRFASAVYSHLPDNPIYGTPPSRLRPIMGFGKVWGNNVTVRTALGWPTLQEMSFLMGVDIAGAYTYFTQFDGSVIEISPDNHWRYSIIGTGQVPPGITAFDVSPNPASARGTVTVEWEVRGVDLAIIEVYAGDNTSPQTLLTDLPVAGSAPITLPDGYDHAQFVLWGANYPTFPTPVTLYERLAQAAVRVDISDSAIPPRSTYAAYQPYERGFMLWRQDTGDVLVFGGNGSTYLVYGQAYYANLPDPSVSVPADRYHPVNAFGKVWGDNQQVRDALGYAVAPERGYTMTVEDLLNNTVTNYYSLPDNRIITIIDGRFWNIS